MMLYLKLILSHLNLRSTTLFLKKDLKWWTKKGITQLLNYNKHNLDVFSFKWYTIILYVYYLLYYHLMHVYMYAVVGKICIQ